MPKFDVKAWKDLCPDPAMGASLLTAIKEWNMKCEVEYDDPSTDPKKLVDVAKVMEKKLAAAMDETEKRLARIKTADPKEQKKIGKAVQLMGKWEGEARHYVAEVVKWSQNALKEETEERKNLWRAQEHFANALINGFEEAMKKLSAPAKEFEVPIYSLIFFISVY